MKKSNCWIYQGECVSTPPSGFYGFIYKITDDQGRIYIGKKAFEHSKKVKISKKARKESGTRKRVEKVKKDSGWLNYFGSCKPLLAYIEGFLHNDTSKISRVILKLCKDKASLSYYEIVYQLSHNVLFRNDCWNNNVGGKYFKGKIHE